MRSRAAKRSASRPPTGNSCLRVRGYSMKISFSLKVGQFIKRFIMADVALFAGWGFLDPLFSVFIINEIAGASLVTIGAVVSIYWILKSLIQIPVAILLDKTNGEKDDFYVLIGAIVLLGIAAFGLTLATKVWHIYFIQILKAVAFGLYIPAYTSLFSHHLDKGHFSLDWSLDSTSVGLAMGVTGFFGGVIVTVFGYDAVFV